MGFMLRVLPSGKKVYYVRYRDSSGKDLRVRIGLTTDIVYADAVQAATETLCGGSPTKPESSGARSYERSGARPRASQGPLLQDFAKRFLAEHVAVRLKPRTLKSYSMFTRVHLIPAFGRSRLHEIQHEDVSRFHASMHETPYAANACLLLLSSMYSHAIKWGVLDRNFTPPTRGIQKFPRRSRERFLTPAERRKLDRFLSCAVELKRGAPGRIRWQVSAAIRLLSMTGMRRDEVLDLTWEMVDFRHRCFRLPDSKTGQKIVPVSRRALELVRECRSAWEACTHDPKPSTVVYSSNGRRIFSCALTRTWTTRVRDQIPGFAGVRLHDLRHSFASDALMGGVPLAVVGKILGHKKPETTARYAHIADSVLHDAVETASEAIHHGTATGRRKGDSRK